MEYKYATLSCTPPPTSGDFHPDHSQLMIDAHQHFWSHNPEQHNWIDDSMQAIRRGFLPSVLAPHVAAAGVTIAV